ncbi:MAG: M56 family metallopeptidase [Gemmatimonadota bacterium]|nr:M56 family metallopeptidase [Gemmatimonadota bacterium]
MTPLGHLATNLPAREQARRRTLLLGVGALIALSTSPVFGHHVATRADAMLEGHDHILNVCLIALHHLLAPVHLLSHTLLLAGLAYALWDRARAAVGVTRTLGALESRQTTPGEPIDQASLRVGLDPTRLRIVQGLPNPAFTAGFWRPHVYVMASLPDVLDADQLDSVLAHELAHVRRRDPLRLSLLRFLACTLFYIPALRRLADDLTDEAEIDADDRAAARGSALVLASAILALAEWGAAHRPMGGAPLPFGAVGFQGFQRVDLLERRVRRLAGEDAEVGTHVTRRSLAAAGAVLVAVLLSGMMMAHPLPAEAMEATGAPSHTAPHCRHPGESALSHLFCLGWRARPAGAPCPHMGL